MQSVLASAKWCRGAQKLLEYSQEIDLSHPTMLFLRHSAREEPKEFEKVLHALLTEEGRTAAEEFGRELPLNWNYRFYFSPIQRCVNTAHLIQTGLKKNKGKFLEIGKQSYLMEFQVNYDLYTPLLMRDQLQFLSNWIKGQYSSEVIEPAFNVAQRAAYAIQKNANTLEKNTIDVYISHDFQLLLFLYYWGEIDITESWIQYIDGFFLQFLKNEMIFYYNEGVKHIPYPDWWSHKGEN
ncbi:MAG: histidine phosphatase family protein [Promethearchaeota archaeon]